MNDLKNHSLGEFEELVLLAVAAQHAAAYGVSIQEDLEQQLGKNINISAIHVALKRMENKGYVRSRFGGITEERGGRRKRYYAITALGKRLLDYQYHLRTSLYNRVPKIAFSK